KAKKNIRAAIERVASRLGNTPTICRKCYVHPQVFSAYLDGALLLEVREEVEAELRQNLSALEPEEAAVLSLLQSRLMRESEPTTRSSRTRKGRVAPQRCAAAV